MVERPDTDSGLAGDGCKGNAVAGPCKGGESDGESDGERPLGADRRRCRAQTLGATSAWPGHFTTPPCAPYPGTAEF